MEEANEKKKVLFSRQEFLNLPGNHSVASVVITAVTGEWEPVTTEVHLNDCSKIICLSVGIEDYEYENTLHKVGKLAEAFSAFHKALPGLREEYIKITNEKKEKEKKEE